MSNDSPDLVLQAHTQAFLAAMTLKSVETGDHLPRVAHIALAFGRSLQLDAEELRALKYGALLHDLGKIAVPDSILHKPARLDAHEWEVLKEHPWRGAAVLQSLDFPAAVCAIVEQHHERWDGSGYPFGLRETAISKPARIFQIADCYDAITSTRCYRPANSHEAAMQEILDWAGIQFDPELARGFAALCEDYLNPIKDPQ